MRLCDGKPEKWVERHMPLAWLGISDGKPETWIRKHTPKKEG